MNVLLEPSLSLTLTAAVFVAGLSERAAAQNPATPDAATQALLAKIDAWRGAPAAGKELTLTIEGTYTVTVERDGKEEQVAKGAFREFFLGTDLMRHTSDMGDMGSMERGLTKDLCWEIDPSMGAKVNRGEHAAISRRFAAFERGVGPRELYREFVRTGTQAIDGVEHTVLRMVPAEGKPDVWYVTAEGAVTRIESSLPTPESADAVWGLGDTMDARTDFADWRAVDGVRHAHKRTMRMGPATVSLVCTKIDASAAIDKAVFTPPEAVTKIKLEPLLPAFGPDGKPQYQVLERKAQPVASIRVKCKPAEISATLGVLLPEVMAHLNATGAKLAGPPFSRYHAMSDTEIDLEAGIPVQKPITAKGRVVNSELPAGKAVTAWHVGPYDKLGAAHQALQAHVTEKKLESRGGPWEIYWTDPGMVPDPAKWRTQLFAPIE